MVEVTKSNFEEMFSQIEKSIKNSSFIALDAEFTGLSLGSEDAARLFDSLEERYQKLKSRASNFIPCQIGLSTFTKTLHENRYSVETFVFFIRPYMCGSTDRTFTCQASSVDFLNCYDFDFNKFMKEGIPYLNETEELLMRKELEDGTIGYCHERSMEQKLRKERDIMINNTIMKSFQTPKNSKASSDQQSTEESKLILPLDRMCHAYFQVSELRRKYPSLWAYATKDSIIVEVVSSCQRKELEKNINCEEKEVLDYYLGFTKVFRILKEAQKPMVGHNLLMDLMLFFHNFHNPLPNTYKKFKEEMHNIFPIVFDTRHIWLNIGKVCKNKEMPKQAALLDLYEIFKNPTDAMSTIFAPYIEHCNGDKYLTGEFPHESGYDSFVTGWVFLKICHLLAMKSVTNSVHIQPQSFKQHLNAVSPFLNKLNLGRSRERYINLSGEDPLPQVSAFLYFTPRKSDCILNQDKLSSIFEKHNFVDIKMNRNKRGAIIAVSSIRSFEDILRDFKDDPDFIVMKYNAYKHSPIVKMTKWITAVGSVCCIAYLASRVYLYLR